MLQTLDAREVRKIEAASRKLERLPAGGSVAGIFDAIRPCVPSAAGLFSIIRPRAPGSLVIQAAHGPPEVFESWIGTPADQMRRVLSPVVKSDAGRLLRDSETLVREQREKLDVLRVLEAASLGEGAGYKILQRSTPQHGAEHLMLALIMERGQPIPARSPLLLAALNAVLRDTILRLGLPLVGGRKALAQLFAELSEGYLCVSLHGTLIEVNRRAHELVTRYQNAARVEGRRNVVTAFAERARLHTPGGQYWKLPSCEPGTWLQVSTHRLTRDAYDLVEDVILVVLQEVIALQLPVMAPRMPKPFTKRELEIIHLLVNTGGLDKEIAAKLEINVRTVEKNMERIRAKADVHTRAELMVRLQQWARLNSDA